MLRPVSPPLVRFEAKFVRGSEDECWIWTGARHPVGHGAFRVDRQTYIYAHRFAYEQYVGPIPEGLVIDHLCMNPPCVNPAHLEPVTQGENSRRYGRTARRQGCVHQSEERIWVALVDQVTRREVLRGEFCSYLCVAAAVAALEGTA